MNDPLTPLQGRLAFHMERIFRSAGGRGVFAHQHFVTLAEGAGLPVAVDEMSDTQCIEGLKLVEQAAYDTGLALFRDCHTGWEREATKLGLTCRGHLQYVQFNEEQRQ